MRLEAIHLASHPLPPYPRQRGNGEDVLAPPTVVPLLSLIFLTTVFTSPFNFFDSVFPLHLSCCELSPLLSPLQRLPPSAVSISLPRAQRQFSRSSPEPFSSLFFIPFPPSLTFSHTFVAHSDIHKFSRLIGAVWSDFGGLMEEGKQHSHQREKLRGRKEKWWNTTFHTCVHHTQRA